MVSLAVLLAEARAPPCLSLRPCPADSGALIARLTTHPAPPRSWVQPRPVSEAWSARSSVLWELALWKHAHLNFLCVSFICPLPGAEDSGLQISANTFLLRGQSRGHLHPRGQSPHLLIAHGVTQGRGPVLRRKQPPLGSAEHVVWRGSDDSVFKSSSPTCSFTGGWGWELRRGLILKTPLIKVLNKRTERENPSFWNEWASCFKGKY